MKEAFGYASIDWKQGIDWAAVREWRQQRVQDAMERHGLGAILTMYDENMRYVTSTLTPGWNRLKPGLRYAIFVEGTGPIVYEQGDIGFHLRVHIPWIPPENIRHSYAWIKGAAGPASQMQVDKFVDALLGRPRGGRRPRPAARCRLHRHQPDADVRGAGHRVDRRHDPDDGGPRDQEPRREQGVPASSGAICDALHYEITKFLKPGLTENQVAAFGFEYLYSIPGMEDVEDVIVSSGPNAWPNWRNFSDRIIRPGELVIIDLAALTWNGFKSCVYRTYCVGGKPTDEMKRYYDEALILAVGLDRGGEAGRDDRATSPRSGRRRWRRGATRTRTRPRRTSGVTGSASPSTTRR